jgi:hypothetical protein
MTTIFYECSHCNKKYEFGQTECDFCTSPIRKVTLEGNKETEEILTMEEIEIIHEMNARGMN